MGNGVSGPMEIFAEGELETELKRLGGNGDISIKKLVKQGYQEVIQSVIRPQRCIYSIDDLGEKEFMMPDSDYEGEDHISCGKKNSKRQIMVRRKDFHVRNDRELKLQCSHWQLFASTSDGKSETVMVTPCLVYLHSNLGSRVDALRIRDQALARGFSVLAFDFCGSGLSDGIYVTMGWNEAKDLRFVLEYLEDDQSVRDICIYAHSMGTFPAIVNVACRSLIMDKRLRDTVETSLPSFFRSANVNFMAKPIKGLVLDGGYATMKQLTEELMESVQREGFHVPKPIMKLACTVIQQSIKKRTDVDLDLLRPIDFVGACSIPALFITGEDDRYVMSHHSEDLQAKYAGPAMIMKVKGEHYTLRERKVYAEAVDFLLVALNSVGMRHHQSTSQ